MVWVDCACLLNDVTGEGLMGYNFYMRAIMRKWSYGHFNFALGLSTKTLICDFKQRTPRKGEMKMNEAEDGLNRVFGEKQRQKGLKENKENEGEDESTAANLLKAQPTLPNLFFTPQKLSPIIELSLAPSGDEILPMRSQELADQCLPDENKLAKIPNVPLGMESTLPTQN